MTIFECLIVGAAACGLLSTKYVGLPAGRNLSSDMLFILWTLLAYLMPAAALFKVVAGLLS